MNQMTRPAPSPTAANLPDEETPSIPFSIEAEQQLLGALLTDNGLYDRIQNIVLGDHFYEPVHARIFDLCAERIRRNALASPVTIKAFMEDDEGLTALGGAPYLARLAGAAISSFAAPDYAQMIREFAMRRSLIGLGNDIAARAASVRVDDDAAEQIKAAEQVLYKLGEEGVAERGFQSFLAAANEAVDIANAAYRRDGQLSGYATGLIDLDAKMGGLNDSDLIILAGLARLFGEVGDVVLAGDPLGMMPGIEGAAAEFGAEFVLSAATGGDGARMQVLYLELRKGRQSLDPADWFAPNPVMMQGMVEGISAAAGSGHDMPAQD